MKKDDTGELIRQIQETRRELASSLYRDFFTNGMEEGAAQGNRPEGGTPAAGNGTADQEPAKTKDQGASQAPVQTQTAGPAQAQAQSASQEPEEDPMETLNSLIGLGKIKHDVRELTDFARIQKARKDAGLRSVPVSLHLVFTGNPGTGKTTVARILAKLYARIGILSKGQLIEVDRSGLVAGYVGQTALKTQDQIQKALGGVLFIDEAYALAQKQDDFGQEAIDTILKAMEDHRDDLIVIVAGYTEPMERFIESNPGLKSRFNKYIEFPDYTLDELMGIFDMNLKKYDYTMAEETRAHVREKLAAEKLASQENFANARAVRNLFEEIITNQARRVAELKDPTLEDLKALTNEDLVDPEAETADALAFAQQLSDAGAAMEEAAAPEQKELKEEQSGEAAAPAAQPEQEEPKEEQSGEDAAPAAKPEQKEPEEE